MEQYVFGAAALVHIAGILQVLGYLSRDQLVLRLFLFAGTLFYLAFYYFSAPGPMWSAMLWAAIFMSTNLYVTVSLINDRRYHALSPDERRLAAIFSTLTPGQFRRLMRAGKWVTAHEETILTREGGRPDGLFFVLDRPVSISKGDRRFTVDPGLFVGEIAWLLGTAATATVEVPAGARYVEWDGEALRALLARNPDLRFAVESLLNRDLAAKVGKS